MTNSDIRTAAEEKLVTTGIAPASSIGTKMMGANVKWLKLKEMIHHVYEEEEYTYADVDDLLGETGVLPDGEKKKLHDMKQTPSLLEVLGDEEDDEEKHSPSRDALIEKMSSKLNIEVPEIDAAQADDESDLPARATPMRQNSSNIFLDAEQQHHPPMDKSGSDRVAYKKMFIDHKKDVMESVQTGGVVTEYRADTFVDIRNQVDLAMYTDAAIELRYAVMKDPAFKALAKKLYDMLKDEKKGHVTKTTYLQLALRINLTMLPPPVDLEMAAKHCNDDWENEVKRARQDAAEKGAALDVTDYYIQWKAFYLSMFELVDMWTAGTEVTEYIDMLMKIMEGITLTSRGKLAFVKEEACHFNAFFNFLGDIEVKKFEERNVGVDDKTSAGEGIDVDMMDKKVQKKQKRHSVLSRGITIDNVEEATKAASKNSTPAKEKKGGKRGKGSAGEEEVKKLVMTVEECTTVIGKLYGSKIAADDYAIKEGLKKTENGKNKEVRIDRFDAFICRFFQQSHPTKAAARRHLRIFTRSVRQLAEEHPRIELFRLLSGIPNLDHDPVVFVPCLVNRYFFPSLRATFVRGDGKIENGPTIVGILGSGVPYTECSLGNLMKAMKPLMAGVGPFAAGLLTGYGHSVREKCAVSSDDVKFKGTWLMFDSAMLLSYDIFVFAHKMSGFSKVRAVRTIQAWVRKGMPALRRGHKLEQWEIEEQEVVEKQASERPIVSPRVRLDEARQLDGELNKDAAAAAAAAE
jgi:hypothetical protein